MCRRRTVQHFVPHGHINTADLIHDVRECGTPPCQNRSMAPNLPTARACAEASGIFPFLHKPHNGRVGRSRSQASALAEVFVNLCKKQAFQVIFPKNMDGLCCRNDMGKQGYARHCRQQDCRTRGRACRGFRRWHNPRGMRPKPLPPPYARPHIKSMPLYEPAEFILDFLAPHLKFNRIDTPIAVHITCSSEAHGSLQAK